MPQGVEHVVYRRRVGQSGIPVRIPLMPQGVEHRAPPRCAGKSQR